MFSFSKNFIELNIVLLYSIPVIEIPLRNWFKAVINSHDPHDGSRTVLISFIYGFNKLNTV